MKDTRTKNSEDHSNKGQQQARLTTMLRKVNQIILKILRRRRNFDIKQEPPKWPKIPNQKNRDQRNEWDNSKD